MLFPFSWFKKLRRYKNVWSPSSPDQAWPYSWTGNHLILTHKIEGMDWFTYAKVLQYITEKIEKFLVWSVYRFDQPSTSINWKSQKIRELTEVLDGVAEVTSEGPQGAVGRGDGRMPSMDLMKKVIKRPPDQKGVPKWSISRGVDVRFKYYYYYTIGVSERACSGRDTRLRPTIT